MLDDLPVTSFFVIHWNGVRIAMSRSRTAEKSSSKPRMTFGWVVRVARAPRTSFASGRFRLTTPFSKNVKPSRPNIRVMTSAKQANRNERVLCVYSRGSTPALVTLTGT
jgi:hypothetical protein